jgi:leucyl/phenylalanyl-tRNA--protein transferase
MPRLPELSSNPLLFPSPRKSSDPDGIIAWGGDLSPERLIAAYRQGLFPWYNEPPILWWSPDPRAVIFLKHFKISQSLKKAVKRLALNFTMNTCFRDVISQCANLRVEDPGTWISPEIQEAYTRLHQLGFAHSAEVYQGDKLVGGIYGIALGRIFFGESMFSLIPNASKIAMMHLVQFLAERDYELIDCQVPSEHLTSIGAELMSRNDYLDLLEINNKFENKL